MAAVQRPERGPGVPCWDTGKLENADDTKGSMRAQCADVKGGGVLFPPKQQVLAAEWWSGNVMK